MLGSLFRTGFSIVSLAGVSACGGPAGCLLPSSCAGPDTAFKGFSQLPADFFTVADGKGVTAPYTAGSTAGSIQLGTVSEPLSAGAIIFTENGAIVSTFLRVGTLGPTNSSSNTTVDLGTAVDVGDVIDFTEPSSPSQGYYADVDGLEFEYQTFAAWINAGGTNVAAGSFGMYTNSGALPSSGSASYSGATAGHFVDASGQPFLTTSTLAITTDFSTATITTAGTQASNFNSGTVSNAANLDFTGSGLVSGNTFMANVTGSGVSGTADGYFYGPVADEVGGTFTASGPDGTYIGGFGGN